MRCANPGPCSSQPQGHKTAFKFQRIRCTICFTSPDNHQKKKTTPGKHVPAFCWGSWLSPMPRQYKSQESLTTYKSRKYAVTKKEVSGCSDWLHSEKTGISPRNPGTAGPAGHYKMVHNRKASCCTLLKRITKLKCVNSEVKSVDIDPNWGCLNWPYGTMSESP